MSDLIHRNKLYNYIKAEINRYGKPFKGSAYEFGVKLMYYILNMETVEVKPVVHGVWLPMHFGGVWMCLNCKTLTNTNEATKFCSECGADMRNEVE